MNDMSSLRNAVVAGEVARVKALAEEALARNVEARTLLDEGLLPAMEEIGRLMKAGELYLPEVVLSARAVQAALTLLKPHLIGSGVEPMARVVIGTVKGDLHDIGKNLVAMMLEGGGFEVTDLGVDVPAERFVAAVKEKDARLLALSALLTSTMPAMESTIAALQEAGMRDRVAVLVGGAPLTQGYADQIGADGFAANAISAVEVARERIRLRA